MAHTTPISELRWSRSPPWLRSPKWFGADVPMGVTHVEVQYRAELDKTVVRWRVRNDPAMHEMPFQHTDEGVMAVLVAMKLTC